MLAGSKTEAIDWSILYRSIPQVPFALQHKAAAK
jgi:hypothetical protein